MEALRLATIAFRGTPTAARRATIVSLVDQLDVTRAEDVIRAFTCYFQLVNLAEERQRLRVLARRARSGKPVKDSIDALDVDASAFEDLRITPVLTAHPTEAKRRAVVEHLWRIGALLEHLEDLPTGAADEQEIHRRLREEIAGLWRTEPIRRHRPEPLDEVRATLALFDQTIFVTLPAIYRAVDRTLDPERCGARPPSFAPFLRWGTWVGGDRDGNPAVTAEVTRAAMAIQTDHALRGMEAAARRIARTLSVSERDVPPSRALRRALDRDAGELPEVATELGRTLSDAPHRRKLGLAAHRLAATRLGIRGAYAGPSEFLTDIETLQRSLEAGGAPRLAWGELQHLRWQVETFGFHLASMEVRQHSSVLATARAEVAEARASRPSPQTREVLATFRAIADIQQRLGPEACERVVVSFTKSAADLAGVLELARVAVPEGPPDVVPVPLLESRHELANATTILDEWTAMRETRALLRRRGNELEVMVGYSDSAKEVGMLAANLELYAAQRSMAAWAREHGLRLTIFHGRGGALGPWRRTGEPGDHRRATGFDARPVQGDRAGRGGVRPLREPRARAAAPGTAHERRGAREPRNPPTLTIPPTGSPRRSPCCRRPRASGTSQLVHADGFVEFFRRVTPIAQIGTLPIASRPVSRGLAAGAVLEDLRAIPWVFAWGQSRVNLTGWYGLGAGLAAVAGRRGGLGRLRAMARAWPFFATLLENAELSLAKADPAIADLYLARGDRPDLSATIREEMLRTTELVLSVTGHDHVLDAKPDLQRAIEFRNPYVDALSFLQVRFLGERPGVRTERLVQATISGVAAGLQNTG